MRLQPSEQSELKSVLQSIEAASWARRVQVVTPPTEQAQSEPQVTSPGGVRVGTWAQSVESTASGEIDCGNGTHGFTAYISATAYGSPSGTWQVTFYGGGANVLAQLGSVSFTTSGTMVFDTTKYCGRASLAVTAGTVVPGSGYHITVEWVCEA